MKDIGKFITAVVSENTGEAKQVFDSLISEKVKNVIADMKEELGTSLFESNSDEEE